MSGRKVTQKVVLAGIVIHDGRALLLKRSGRDQILPGLWELPSGKKEDLEDWREALIREVAEESGIDAEPVAPIDVYGYVVEKDGETRDMTQINFLMRVIGEPEVRLSDEHDDFAWVTEPELDRRNTSEQTKHAIRMAFGHEIEV